MAIIPEDRVATFRKIAGYRNRIVHFYHEITQEDLYTICTSNISDIEEILENLIKWIQDNPEKIDHEI
jgi:uncharacterized protein YutE (UPF0331/DUF86 family)